MKYKKTRYPGIFKYETKNGIRYRARIASTPFYGEHSKQGFKSVNEALAYLTRAKEERESGLHTNSKRTLKKHWEEYSEAKLASDSWKLSTQQTIKYKMQPWLDKFGDQPLADISKADIQVYINKLYEENNYSQETVESYFRTFLQVVDDAVEEGYLPRNIFRKISTKSKEHAQPREKTISIEAYREFMGLAKEHMRKDVYRCLYLVTFGLRRSEAYAITQSAVTYLDNGLATIHVNKARTANYTSGTSVKSADSNRHVVVDSTAADMLSDQVTFARTIKANFNRTLHQDDYIFVSPKTGNPYPIKTLNNHIDKITPLMKNPVNITPHMLRHMFATYASASGVDALQLRKYLGHGSLEMTDHYTKSTVQAGENIIKQIEGYHDF